MLGINGKARTTTRNEHAALEYALWRLSDSFGCIHCKY